jgi:hypothetical protein
MKTYHQILLAAIILFLMMFAGIWLFNHVYAWLGVAVILLTIYAAVRVVIYFINKQNK